MTDPVTDVARAANVDLRRGEEDRDADVDEQATLDLALGDAFDDVAFLVGLDDLFPTADAVGLALAERDVAFFVVDRFDECFDLRADA